MRAIRTTMMAQLVALALVASLFSPTAGRIHPASGTLIPDISKDLVAAINGGNVAFATSDYPAGSLPAGQPGWAPTSSLGWGAEKLIDGHASTTGTNCSQTCEWAGVTGIIPTAAAPVDLVFTF